MVRITHGELARITVLVPYIGRTSSLRVKQIQIKCGVPQLTSMYWNFYSSSQEAYRRWVCSTLIPYFVEPNDIALHQNRKSSTSDRQTLTGEIASIIGEMPFHVHSHSENSKESLVFKLLNRLVTYSKYNQIVSLYLTY